MFGIVHFVFTVALVPSSVVFMGARLVVCQSHLQRSSCCFLCLLFSIFRLVVVAPPVWDSLIIFYFFLLFPPLMFLSSNMFCSSTDSIVVPLCGESVNPMWSVSVRPGRCRCVRPRCILFYVLGLV